MIRDPIATLDDGGFAPYGAPTHHAALAYALNPDDDGVSREEPSSGVLLLRYSAGKVAQVYLRGRGSSDAQGTPLAVTVRLYDGATLLREVRVVLHDTLTTHTWRTHESAPLSGPRVAVLTSEVQPQDVQPGYAYLTLTMLVVEGDEDAPPPPVRVTRLIHTRDYLSARWVLQVETNDPAPIDPPAGFRIVSASPPLRVVGGRAYPPDDLNDLQTYELELSEV